MKQIIIMSLVLLVFTGCVSNSAYRAQEERVTNLESALMQNNEELVVLRKEIMQSRRSTASTVGSASDIEQLNQQLLQNEADMRSMLEEHTILARTVNEMNANIVEADRQIVQMIQDLEYRINTISTEGMSPDQIRESSPELQRQVEANTEAIRNLRAEIQSLKEKIENVPFDSQPGTIEQSEVPEYEAARDEYYKGNFNTARTKLDAFLAKYPNSKYSGNAVYWKGESYYAQARFNEALREFQNVLSRYPKSWKAGDAQFKIGLTYKQMGDHEAARTELNKVKTSYPSFERMDLVEQHLAQIK